MACRVLLFITLIGLPVYSQSKADVDLKDLKKSIRFLAADQRQGRELGSPGIEEAAQFIETSFNKNGVQPYYTTYRDTFQFKDKTGYNLIGYKKGTDPDFNDQLIILSAHYDHLGTLPAQQGDSIANGANDDASGTAAILELANYFEHKDTKRSVLFVLFSGEEKGLIGSRHLARRLKEEKANVYAMIEYEMIGAPLKDKPYLAYLTGFDKSSLADAFNSHARQDVLGLFRRARQNKLFKRSDNYPFYSILNIPAHTLSTFTFTNFDQYHKVGDEIGLVDFRAMKKLIEASIPGIEGLLNGAPNEIHLKTNQ